MAILLLSFLTASGQDKCGTPVYMELNKQRDPTIPNKNEFEEWIEQKHSQKLKSKKNRREGQEIYLLPVVVHIIHKGEPVGSGSNIPDFQIRDQIESLNTDFRRRNENQVNALPAEFRQLAADTEIEFVLAKQDPEGLPTSGITRTRGGRNTYRMEDDLALKGLIHWDPENFINIYVVDLAADVIGYAQFPETDKLPGLELGKVSGQTDGVVIDFKYFGRGGSADASSLGRTLTHEMGHFFGLRHTWGDGDCSTDDYVEDTPLSSEDYDGFNDCNRRPVSCQSPDMFQNYLTYASDGCMALFTPGQKERMDVVLQHSPRRSTLKNSYAVQEPVIVSNDAGISLFTISVIDPCTKEFLPTINVRNYGTNNISSFDLAIHINGLMVYSRAFSGLNLSYLEMVEIQLNTVEVFAKGDLKVEARLENVNGTFDNKPFNNKYGIDLFVPYLTSTPFIQDFETSLTPFYKINPDFFLTWQLTKAPVSGDPNNLAAYMNFYDYERNTGTKDLLISPILNLQEAEEAFLSFRYAYAQYQSRDNDGLEVWITTDCSNTLDNAIRIFDKRGSALATTSPTTEPFAPTANEHWRTEQIDLSEFVEMENLQVIFAGVNDYGNNLYLDDIEIFNEPRKGLDISVHSINYPSVVSCDSDPIPGVLFRNAGTETVNSMEVIYSLDNTAWEIIQFPDLSLGPQSSVQLQLPQYLNLREGIHNLRVRVSAVNNTFDENPLNDVARKAFAINTSQDSIPLRQRFTDAPPINDTWVNITPSPGSDSWVIRNWNGNESLRGNAAVSEFFEKSKGQENWLVSPTLNLSELTEAGVQFEHSYAPLSTSSDILQIRVSTNCGISWSKIMYEKSGSELSARKTQGAWRPSSDEDWDVSFVDLSEFAGLPEVRVAFIAISDGGNDIYIDNIEFFQSSVPLPGVQPAENSLYIAPNPASQRNPPSLTFNLNERENVRIKVFNSRGALVFEQLFPNVLNQKINLNVEGWGPGMYFLKANSINMKESLRFILLQ